MENNEQILRNKLNEYLHTTKNPEHDLTAKKLDRMFDVQVRDGCLFFSINRHQQCLGAQNRRGSGMAAMAEWREDYKYDPDAGSIDVVSYGDPELTINDLDDLVYDHIEDISFRIEKVSDAKFSVEDATNGIKEEFPDLQSALEYFMAQYREFAWTDLYHSEEAFENMDKAKKTEIFSEVEHAILKALEERFKRDWNRAVNETS